MAATAMLTARVPADVKERAAENLALMGYTTSQAVQFIWQYLADAPVNEGKKFLEPAAQGQDEETQRRLEAFERSKDYIMTAERFERLFGIKVESPIEPISDEELASAREAYLEEKYLRGER